MLWGVLFALIEGRDGFFEIFDGRALVQRINLDAMPAPTTLKLKSCAQIKNELLGFPPSCIEAALRYRDDGQFDSLIAMLPGMIEFHLPKGTAKPPSALSDELRLCQDLGLDSLALAEMAFKMDDVFGISIETHEMAGVETVGALKAFLRAKLNGDSVSPQEILMPKP